MPTLTTYRLLGIHLIGLLSGIYVAAWIAHFFGWFWPGSRLPAFIIVSLFFACGEVSMTIRELRRGRLSTGLIILDYMPFLLLGGGVSRILGWLATRWFGSDMGGLVVFIGVYYCILLAIAAVKYSVQDRNLEEDLKKSPENTRSARPPIITDASGHSQNFEDTVPPSRWTVLQNIAKALLVIVVLVLFFILVHAFHG